MTDDDRLLCAVAAARIEAQLQLGWLSVALTTLASWALWQHALQAALLAAVAAGLAERYVAVRLALDRGVLQALALPAGADLGRLDAAFAALGLVAPSSGAPRPLDDRLQGVRRWLRRHALLVVAQLAMFFLARGLA